MTDSLITMIERNILEENKPYKQEVIEEKVQDFEKQNYGKNHKDVQRAIRKLSESQKLVYKSEKKGYYCFDRNYQNINRTKEMGKPFDEHTKEEIKKRDNYTCRHCGKYLKNNKDDCIVDHIKSLQDGGSNDISNGQVLCVSCNNKKRNKSEFELGLKEIESGLKKMGNNISEEKRIKLSELSAKVVYELKKIINE